MRVDNKSIQDFFIELENAYYDRFIHVSHNDLDGYGCSYVINKYLGSNNRVNLDYGDINNFIKDESLVENSFVLFTDLNLSINQCDYLESLDIRWAVIDHHGTGVESALAYPDNYYLNIDNSATYLCFDILSTMNIFDGMNINSINHLKSVVDIIDSYDMWRKDSPLFNYGTLLSDYIYKNPFYFKELKSSYSFFIFDEMSIYRPHTISEVEFVYPNLFRKWINSPLENSYDISTNKLCALKHLEHFNNYYNYKNDKFIIYPYVPGAVAQYCFDELLSQEDYKDKVLISLNLDNGKCSFRSVNDLSSTYAKVFNGGGHPNSAGCGVKIEEGMCGKMAKELEEFLND